MRPIDSYDFGILSDRDHQVLQLLAHGTTNNDIAHCLGLTPGTVRNVIAAILNRLGVADRTQAALLAYHAGLAHDTLLPFWTENQREGGLAPQAVSEI
jgi:DNA-binding NarL/FixJ family response regulator